MSIRGLFTRDTRAEAVVWRRLHTPTTSLYFINACGQQVQAKRSDGGYEQIGPNCFRTDFANLIIRQDLPEVIGPILADRTRKLVYLIDDHMAAYATDAELPSSYSQRLASRWQQCCLPALTKAELVVTTSPFLSVYYGQYGPTAEINPAWHSSLTEGLEGKLAHNAGQGVTLAYLGTASHETELAFLMPVLCRLLRDMPNVKLVLPGGISLPAELTESGRVTQRWPVPWNAYQAQLKDEHFDICLYPSLNSPFAAGRSRNKLIEQALTGAFGIFSDCWPHAEFVAGSGAGSLVPNRPDAWLDGIAEAIANLPNWRARSGQVASLIRTLNDLDGQRRFWERELHSA